MPILLIVQKGRVFLIQKKSIKDNLAEQNRSKRDLKLHLHRKGESQKEI